MFKLNKCVLKHENKLLFTSIFIPDSLYDYLMKFNINLSVSRGKYYCSYNEIKLVDNKVSSLTHVNDDIVCFIDFTSQDIIIKDENSKYKLFFDLRIETKNNKYLEKLYDSRTFWLEYYDYINLYKMNKSDELLKVIF